MTRNGLILIVALAGLSMMTGMLRAAEPLVLPLWPDGTAGVGSDADEKATGPAGEKPDRFITNVRHPTLTVYLPPKEHASGAAVVICPGGGYSGVAIDKEGHDVARWLNTLGIAGVVLKYRMPHPDRIAGPEALAAAGRPAGDPHRPQPRLRMGDRPEAQSASWASPPAGTSPRPPGRTSTPASRTPRTRSTAPAAGPIF